MRQESLAYGRKLQALKNEVDVVLYRGIGHAFLDKIGVLPQAEDFVNEMGQFILERSKKWVKSVTLDELVQNDIIEGYTSD